jgi:hypothetical protein
MVAESLRYQLALTGIAGLVLEAALLVACSSSAGPTSRAEPDADGGAGANGSGSSGVGGPTGAEGDSGGGSGPAQLPASCSAAVKPYSVHATALDPSVVPVQVANYWGGTGTPEMRTMVTVDATNKVYAGVIEQNGSSFSSVIAAEGSAVADMITLPGAILGGLAATKDGLGALLYDPTTVDQRLWAQVKRLGPDGKQRFSTDLFRSANLTDDMTRATRPVVVWDTCRGPTNSSPISGTCRCSRVCATREDTWPSSAPRARKPS